MTLSVETIERTLRYVSLTKSLDQQVNHVHIDNNMSVETTKIKRLYQVPKQDKHAFSLQYKKDTSKDPSLFTKTRNGKGLLKKGGTIHIKPENKGKFTATKKKTGKSTEELTHSSNPVTKKRAIFAMVSKRWSKNKKKAQGGLLHRSV
jgi:hypothetical protein